MADRTVSVKLQAEVGQYVSGMSKAAASTKTVGTSATVAGKQSESAFTRAGRGATLLGAALGGAAVIGLKGFVDAASNAEQSLGGVQAVFKGYANSVITNSKNADRALGLSANSYRELATVIGSQMKNAGVPLDELAGKTEDIIGIGADLAAQFGGSTQQAVEALSSAFRGELDPIERYGISLSAAAVGAKAVEMGLADSATELSQNAKAMATLALVTEQSADAQGAFAREADTAAGRAARASAAWENLKVQVGDQLLPVWSALVDVVGNGVIPAISGVLGAVGGLVSAFGDLPAPLQVAIGALGAVALLKNPVSSAFDAIAAKAVTAGSAFMGAELGMSGLKRAGAGLTAFFGGPWGLAISGAAIGLSLLVEWLGETDEATEGATEAQLGLEQALMQSKGAIDANVRAAAAKAAQDENLLDVAQRAGVELSSVTDAILGQGNAYNETIFALTQYRDARVNGSEADRRAAAAANDGIAALMGLAGQTDTNIVTAQQLALATAETGDVIAGTVGQTAEATAAMQAWRDMAASALQGFTEPLSVYQGLLQQKTESERAQAQATADATEDASDSWEDYVDDVGVSLNEYADKLQKQLQDQQNWRRNLVIIASRAGRDVADQLMEMGEEGVQLTADMANGTDAEVRRMARLLRRDAELAGEGATDALATEMRVMERVGKRGANDTARSIAEELGIGVDKVAAIAAQYGIDLARGINPIIGALGRSPIDIEILRRKQAFADGGYTGPGGKYTPAGIVHAGEFVVPKERVDALGVSTIGQMVGMRGYADGGFVTSSDVPQPRSTSPYRAPISTAGNAAMGKMYDEVIDYVRSNAVPPPSAAGPAGTGSIGGGWQSIWSFVSARIPQARINSTYRPGDPGYHGLGKAVDFGFGSGPGGLGSAGLASINRLLYDSLGSNLAELIYDGIGDDRPDIKNGRPLTYSAATRAQHRNHVHAAVYDQGGPLYPGLTVAYNGTGKTEWVSTERPSPGGGGAGGFGPVVVNARVFVGNREITDIARVEAEAVVGGAFASGNRALSAAGVR